MIRVATGSRLHFGLIRLVAKPGERCFGGAGLMLADPGVAVRVEAAEDWFAEGPQSDRALSVARSLAALLQGEPRRIVVEQAAPEHAGLGTGTQLSLATAKAVTQSWGLSLTTPDLARLTGRGTRSAIGVHGFDCGGFLVDGGKSEDVLLAPLVIRADFPADWRVLIILPTAEKGLAGSHEREAFSRLQHPQPTISDALCRLLVMGVLPALAERDFPAFSAAIFEYNLRAGELFAPVQGGIYACPEVVALIDWLSHEGVIGRGQSSWGPGVFGFVDSEEQGKWLLDRTRKTFPTAQVWLTAARHGGAELLPLAKV